MGYPGNLLYDYRDVYRFLAFTINNVGDPFVDGQYDIHTHPLEREVIAFFADLFHAPKESYWGYVTNGGTEGNVYGLYLAREALPESVVYFSDNAHYGLLKAARFMQFPMSVIPSQPNGEMNYEEFEEAIRTDRRAPIIVATVGTTMKGAIDRIEKIVAALQRQNITKFYIHCDAALLGMVLPFLDNAPLFDFRLPISSLSVSGHKMIGSPIPCGVVIARLENVERIQRHIELIGAPDTTLSGSRNGHTVLFLWYAMRRYGHAGFKAMIENCLEVTRYALRRFADISWEAHAENFSVTILIRRPSDAIVKKWQLAVEGESAHVVIMPNVTKENIDALIADISAET